jgi:hypothetical protein
MRRLVVVALAVATSAFVPPKRDVAAEVTGEYEAVGTHPDKSTYRGRATIVRLSGERYEITFHMDTGVFRALCLRVRDVLACGWGLGKDVTVAVWQQGSGVTGLWTADHVTTADAIGREESAMQTLDSPFGINPDGVGYESSVSTLPYGALHRVTWARGAITSLGWGIRAGSLLIAGFPSHSVGAAFYRIGPNGTSLVGEWMDPNAAPQGLGTETLTR